MSTRQRSVSWAILLVVLLVSRPGAFGEEEAVVDAPISIIPAPVVLERGEGFLLVEHPFGVLLESGTHAPKGFSRFLGGLCANHSNVVGPLSLTAKDAPERLGEEGYLLDVTPQGITLTARAPAGFFYGVQTLRQLLPADAGESAPTTDRPWRIPALHVEDRPRFPWRGMHLDVGRHFRTADEVKRFLDLMAYFKLNTFHWHLTEDQGWRIEIKRYPKLVEVGSRRAESPKPGARTEGDGTPYAGHYTQDEIREVVAYAAERFITVVPEIEMPGHAQAAIAAYPELGNTDEPLGVRTRWGVSRHVFNVEESTFEFLEKVLDEVMALFPGPFVHIGGDECPKDEWKASAKAQARMKAEGLKDEHELQSWFVRRIERYLAAHDRRLIGWDEIQEGGLPPGAAMMVWRSVQYGIDAVRQGHDVVMSPTSHCYFDYCQGDPRFEPEAIGGLLPLERVYAFEPVPAGLTADEAKHVLGAQGNLWSEYLRDFDHVLYMAFPRGAALAEVVWSPAAHRDLDDFRRRWADLEPRLALMGASVRREPPRLVAEALIFSERGSVAFEDPGWGRVIRYTLDGSVPGPGALPYLRPIRLEKTAVVTAATFPESGSGPASAPVRVDAVRYDAPPPAGELEPGLIVSGYEGEFSRVPDFLSLDATFRKPTDGFGLGHGEPENACALLFEGFLEVQQAGVVTFAVGSDDGSVLALAGARIVDNDGLHGYVVRRGRVHLEPGVYPLELGWFEREGAQSLTVEIDGRVKLLRHALDR